MKLGSIREELDRIGRSLDYMILLRLSLAILVGEIKEEQKLPIHQPEREETIYRSQKEFAEQTGADPESLVRIFRELIASAIRMEENMDRYRIDINGETLKIVEQELDASSQKLWDFIRHMDSVKELLHKNGIAGDELLALLAEYYKAKVDPA